MIDNRTSKRKELVSSCIKLEKEIIRKYGQIQVKHVNTDNQLLNNDKLYFESNLNSMQTIENLMHELGQEQIFQLLLSTQHKLSVHNNILSSFKGPYDHKFRVNIANMIKLFSELNELNGYLMDTIVRKIRGKVHKVLNM